jgi:hypothetical protein
MAAATKAGFYLITGKMGEEDKIPQWTGLLKKNKYSNHAI